MIDKMPKKPKSHEEQASTLWDIVNNCIWTKICWLDIKLNFILAFMALVLGLLGIILARG